MMITRDAAPAVQSFGVNGFSLRDFAVCEVGMSQVAEGKERSGVLFPEKPSINLQYLGEFLLGL